MPRKSRRLQGMSDTRQERRLRRQGTMGVRVPSVVHIRAPHDEQRRISRVSAPQIRLEETRTQAPHGGRRQWLAVKSENYAKRLRDASSTTQYYNCPTLMNF